MTDDEDEYEVHREAILALWDEIAALRAAGEPAPPPLIARACRLMPADEYRLEYRVMMHVAARYGDEECIEALRLLADDEWWSATPRVLEPWPPWSP